MKRKLFTFLMAFLATLSGAVWAQQDYPDAGSGDGTEGNPYILDLNNPDDIGGTFGPVEWHGEDLIGGYDAFQIKESGYYKIINSAGPDAISTYRIDIDNGIYTSALEVTLILDNVNITVGEDGIPTEGRSPIYIEDNGSITSNEHQVTIQLIGENHITYSTAGGGNGCAIWVNGNSNLTIEGKGSLYATGAYGIGNDEGIAGDITIESGTVVANGTSGAGFGGTNDNGTNLNINGNTFVVSNGTGNVNENFTSGIYYDSSEGDYTAEVKGDITLDSSYPSADEILGSKLKLDIANDASLGLGEGVSFSADRLSDPNDKSKLKVYEVTYGLTSAPNQDGVTVSPTSITTQFAGPNTDLSTVTVSNTEGGTAAYKFLGWQKDNSIVAATPEEEVTTLTEYGVNGVFLLTKYSVNIPTGEKLGTDIELVRPNSASGITITESENTLADLGMKIEGTKLTAGDNAIDSQKETKEYTVTLQASYGDSQTESITITVNVTQGKTDLTGATVTLENNTVVYSGQAIENVNVKSVTTTDGKTVTDYEVKFKKTEDDENYMTENPKDQGTYYVYAVAKENSPSYIGTSNPATLTITAKPITNVTVSSDPIEWTIDTEGPNFSPITFASTDIYDVDKKSITIKKGENSDPQGPWTIAGSYDITFSNLTLEGNEKGNYSLDNSVIATGKLIVSKDLGEEGEEQGGPDDDDTDVKIDDTEEGGWKWSADDNAYVRKYDGTTHSLDVDGLIKVRQENGDDDWVAVPAEQMEISYTYSKPTAESTLTNEGDPKNAGSYVATITISEAEDDNLYVSGTAKINLKITEADLTVDLKLESITWAQMDNPKELLVVDNFGLIYDPESLSSTEGDAVKSSLSSALEKVTATATADENKETATITINGLKLVDTESFYADNYNVAWKNGETPITPGEDGSLEIGGIDITPETPEDEDLTPAVEGDEDDWKWNAENKSFERTYDGEPHNLTSLKIKNLNDSEYSIISAEYGDYAVTYTYSATGFDAATETVQEVKKAGYYKASITLLLDGYTEENIEMLLYIAKADLSVDLNLPNTITVEEAENPSTWWSADDAEVNAVNEAESNAASVSGKATITETELTPGETVSITISDLKVNDQDPFFSSNYNDPTWGDGITVANGSATVEVTVVDDDPDYPGGEVTPGDEEGDDDTWTWNVDKKAFTHVYDGHVHSIETIIITKDGTSTTLNVGEDFGISGIDNMKNVGKYPAVITFNNPATYGFATIQMPLEITKRPMKVDFNLPSSVSSLASQKVDDADVDYELQSEAAPEDRGLLNDDPDETYPVIQAGAQFLFTQTANDKCKVTLKNFILLANSTSGFDPDNYQLQIWDATAGQYVDYNNNGGDITIVDPEGPNEDQNPNLPEDGDGNIDYNPGGSGDDDDNNPGHGGSDINRPAKYYNMYVDSAATCDGVELWFDKNVVRAGNQASVYVKIEEGYDAEHMKLWFKRSLYGYWEELEEDVQPGEYIIYNVYTDIYVKATDVEKDPTGIEEIEGVKVYAQNGSIYVYTPSRLPVWIVSMTGAVVRNEEQVGLQQYDRLNQGIYIVRVGKQVFKIRL